MAQAIAQRHRDARALVAEAGTGTGKTFAYLVPALLYGGKVIVSTGTKTLQDQLFERDLPLVRDALARAGDASRCSRAAPTTSATTTSSAPRARTACRRATTCGTCRRSSRSPARRERGDRAELADVPENATIWPLVTSTRDNCLGQNCAHHADCFVMKARKEALDADVVVVNHHLFFADVMLRDEGVAELLPNCNTVILDEAHQLPDTATLFFGEQVSGGQLAELARDAELAARTAARDVPGLPDAAGELVPAIRKLRLAAGDVAGQVRARRRARRAPGFADALDGTRRGARPPGHRARAVRRARRGAGAGRARAPTKPRAQVARWRDGADAVPDSARGRQRMDPLDRRHAARLPAAGVAAVGRAALRGARSKAARARGSSPRPRWRSAATSRTTQRSSGSTPRAHRRMGQPLRLRRAGAALRAARPAGAQFARAHRCRGRRRAAADRGQRAAARSCCSPRCARSRTRASGSPTRSRARASTIRCWCRARARARELLVRFRELGNAVLLGSASFWEGVDVPGDALSLVVIDKLPFAPPDDPLLAARLERLRAEGGNPFMAWQLPQAAISLKQGAGRLIRTETDRGVLAICDPRLVDKPYGRRIWQSLPPMRRTREEAERWLPGGACVRAGCAPLTRIAGCRRAIAPIAAPGRVGQGARASASRVR